MSERRSTPAFFLGGLRSTLFYLVAWWLLGRFLWPGRFEMAAGILFGCFAGLAQMAFAYRRVEWRDVVLPLPVLGAGLIGSTIFMVWLIAPQYNSHSFDLVHTAAVGAMLVAPAYLVLVSARQLRKPVGVARGASGT